MRYIVTPLDGHRDQHRFNSIETAEAWAHAHHAETGDRVEIWADNELNNKPIRTIGGIR